MGPDSSPQKRTPPRTRAAREVERAWRLETKLNAAASSTPPGSQRCSRVDHAATPTLASRRHSSTLELEEYKEVQAMLEAENLFLRGRLKEAISTVRATEAQCEARVTALQQQLDEVSPPVCWLEH